MVGGGGGSVIHTTHVMCYLCVFSAVLSDICTLPLFWGFGFFCWFFLFVCFLFVCLFFLHVTCTICLHSYNKDENIKIDKTMKTHDGESQK